VIRESIRCALELAGDEFNIPITHIDNGTILSVRPEDIIGYTV